jgi:hypothetical protein
MSVKRCELTFPSSTERIREAMAKFKKMPKEKRIDLMVKAGVMTVKQAERAKKALAEGKAIK